MRGLWLVALVVAALAVPVGAAEARGCPGADAVPGPATLPQARRATLCMVNRERRRHDVRRVRSVAALRHSASLYAREMVRESFFAHVTPAGLTFAERIRRQTGYLDGARSWWIAENIGWGSGTFATPSGIVRAWMHSSEHRRNLLDGRYRDLGVGIAVGAPSALAGASPAATFVTHFGRRE
jgi:uncharacterized protein YkwD